MKTYVSFEVYIQIIYRNRILGEPFTLNKERKIDSWEIIQTRVFLKRSNKECFLIFLV